MRAKFIKPGGRALIRNLLWLWVIFWLLLAVISGPAGAVARRGALPLSVTQRSQGRAHRRLCAGSATVAGSRAEGRGNGNSLTRGPPERDCTARRGAGALPRGFLAAPAC